MVNEIQIFNSSTVPLVLPYQSYKRHMHTFDFPGRCSAIFSHLCSVPLGYCRRAHSRIVCWFLFQSSESSIILPPSWALSQALSSSEVRLSPFGELFSVCTSEIISVRSAVFPTFLFLFLSLDSLSEDCLRPFSTVFWDMISSDITWDFLAFPIPPTSIKCTKCEKSSHNWDLNPRPLSYCAGALTTEL